MNKNVYIGLGIAAAAAVAVTAYYIIKKKKNSQTNSLKINTNKLKTNDENSFFPQSSIPNINLDIKNQFPIKDMKQFNDLDKPFVPTTPIKDMKQFNDVEKPFVPTTPIKDMKQFNDVEKPFVSKPPNTEIKMINDIKNFDLPFPTLPSAFTVIKKPNNNLNITNKRLTDFNDIEPVSRKNNILYGFN